MRKSNRAAAPRRNSVWVMVASAGNGLGRILHFAPGFFGRRAGFFADLRTDFDARLGFLLLSICHCARTDMKYCSHCGAPLSHRIPDGDNRHRYVCDACGTVHYQNPRMVVGCLPVWEDKVLLCRRAIEPRYGLWTLPAGFMENGETTAEGAIRETREEAGARVELDGLYSLINVPDIDQVYLLFRGRLLDLDFAPGEES